MARPHFIDTCNTIFLAFAFIIFTVVILLKKNDVGIENFDTICDRMCYDAETRKIPPSDFVQIDILHAACGPCPIFWFYRPNELAYPEKWIRIKSWQNKTTVIYNNFDITEFQQSFQVKTKYSLTTLHNNIFRTEFQ